MNGTLKKALAISVTMIEEIRKADKAWVTFGEAARMVESIHAVKIDGAAPMNIWDQFVDGDGNPVRVFSAYGADDIWPIICVTQIEALPALIRYYGGS